MALLAAKIRDGQIVRRDSVLADADPAKRDQMAFEGATAKGAGTTRAGF